MARRRRKPLLPGRAGPGRRRGRHRRSLLPWLLLRIGLPLWLLALLALIVIGVPWLLRQQPEGFTIPGLQELVFPEAGAPAGLIAARVERVVDGDTIVVGFGGGTERVRLLSVDTPESVHPDATRNHPLGRAASDFTRQRLEGRQVVLEPGPGDEFDRYGRRLAYVLVEGENFNVELVRAGHSPYDTRFGESVRYGREFRVAEREAREARRGIWVDPEFARSLR